MRKRFETILRYVQEYRFFSHWGSFYVLPPHPEFGGEIGGELVRKFGGEIGGPENSAGKFGRVVSRTPYVATYKAGQVCDEIFGGHVVFFVALEELFPIPPKKNVPEKL